ncbi:MAG: FHA domain-containing protein, partial [Deltaproteobacteria bacterium]|nr:FHA domain-containing protein [Deltaproteobacteria bacterium]
MKFAMRPNDDDLTPPPFTPMPSALRTAELDGAYLKADVMALTGELAGRRFVIDDELLIGRDADTTIQVPGNDVSRHHCRVYKTTAGHYVLEDLGSRNGTLVNGKPIEMHILQFGDRFQVGTRTLFVLTNHEALEEQLVRWQRIELIAEMSAGLVHDFNNCMAAVLGYVDYLEYFSEQEDISLEELQETLQSALPSMKLAAQEGSNLAQKVLLFARGTKEESFASISFMTLTNEASKVVGPSFGDAITIDQRIQPGLRVRGDRTELLQVLINLMLNARDAMPEGGSLSIEARAEHGDQHEARDLQLPEADEGLVVIKVSDTGTGMDEATRKRIFEPLYSTKAKGKGTGLGLSTVARIIENHGGQIKVQSTPGEGTTFTFFLPLATEAGEAREPTGPTMQVAGMEGTLDDALRNLVVMMGGDEEMRQRVARAVYALG